MNILLIDDSVFALDNSAAAAAVIESLRTVSREGDNYLIALDNDAGIDDDGWCLVAPFGEHLKVRQYRDAGAVKEQTFIQVLDNDSADALVNSENSFFSKLKRAIVGIPIYKGHGDLNDVDAKAIGNTSEKIKLGVIDKIRKSPRGIEAHFALDNDGAKAVAEGWKFPSCFWLVMPSGTRALANSINAIVAKPFKLLSVALTPFPNISGVESLANARPTEPAVTAAVAAITEPQTNNHMKQILIGWLAAQGIALANDATDQAVFDAFNKEMLTRSTSVAALGNEKTTLNTTIGTLTTDRDTQKRRADEAATALGNEQTAHKGLRKTAASLVVDAAVRLGIKTVAERDAAITALENSTKFQEDADALLKTAPVRKTTTNGLDVTGKQSAALGNEAQALQNEYQQAFAAELIAAGQDPIKAHRNIMTLPKYSGLACKLVPK
ncbi:MAG TPA: hypothetical protein VK742_20410 [Candidatus Sulfotelmatobacter sp.]|jgi:hypothetical protein|nr:hypothetical protein [Candidatus Sulfotelmatobacter sp.]